MLIAAVRPPFLLRRDVRKVSVVSVNDLLPCECDGDPVWKYHWQARMDTQALQLWQPLYLRDQLTEPRIREGKRIAAAQDQLVGVGQIAGDHVAVGQPEGGTEERHRRRGAALRGHRGRAHESRERGVAVRAIRSFLRDREQFLVNHHVDGLLFLRHRWHDLLGLVGLLVGELIIGRLVIKAQLRGQFGVSLGCYDKLAVARLDDAHSRTLSAKLARSAKPRKPGPHNYDIRPLAHREGYSMRLAVYSILVIFGGRGRRYALFFSSKD